MSDKMMDPAYCFDCTNTCCPKNRHHYKRVKYLTREEKKNEQNNPVGKISKGPRV